MWSDNERPPAPRFARVAPFLAQGMRNEEIAELLSLATHTVENYVAERKGHFACRDRVELVLKLRTLLDTS